MERVWISHRGYRPGNIIENSKDSFRLAIENGFEHLETDLQTSLDGHIVISHDRDFSRHGGSKLPIHQSTRAQLEKIRLQGGNQVLFFDDFWDTFQQWNWTFDIKPESAFATIDRLKSLEPGWMKKVKFLFWDPKHESYARKVLGNFVSYAQEPECYRVGLASMTGSLRWLPLRSEAIYSIPPRALGIEFYQEKRLAPFKKRGLKILAYLPENRLDTYRATELPFDEVLINGLPPIVFR